MAKLWKNRDEKISSAVSPLAKYNNDTMVIFCQQIRGVANITLAIPTNHSGAHTARERLLQKGCQDSTLSSIATRDTDFLWSTATTVMERVSSRDPDCCKV